MELVTSWQAASVRRRVGVTRWLSGSRSSLVALALLVGVGAGLGAVVFRWLIARATRVFTGTSDYSAAGRAPHPGLPWLGVFFVVLTPVAGACCTGRWWTGSPGRPAGTGCPR